VWKPYTEIEVDGQQKAYRYSPVCNWWLYATIALLGTGMILDVPALGYVALGSIALYLVLVTLPSIGVARKIRAAARTANVEIRGSRWSISDPLTFVVREPAEPAVPESEVPAQSRDQ
jgi:hypothetical protein